MKIIGVIPARYNSSRLPGKPLVDISGKPMIWWVYNQAKKVKELDEIYVATDDYRIVEVCETFDIKYIMTSSDHPNHIYRVHEVSTKIDADYYVCINGDEPIIEPNVISEIIPGSEILGEEFVVLGLMREFTEPGEVIDFANLKVVTNRVGHAIYLSRSPVPYPKGTLLFKYKKYVGVECFNKNALNFYVETAPGEIELIEDIDHLRFLENGISINFKLVNSSSLSVDTVKDLDKVRIILNEIHSNEGEFYYAKH
jgi:3-deoxy-manno-octulosonate cytidylyltransferase (CMP-KDO synthetase)